jgi:hypothetical protein
VRVVKQTARYVILDDVLPPEQFELMVEYAARSDYGRNPHMRDGKVETIRETWDVLTKDDQPFWR